MSVPKAAPPKVSSAVEGLEWRYEEMCDYLALKGLKFVEGTPSKVSPQAIQVVGLLQFDNPGRNHWTFITVMLCKDEAEAAATAAQAPDHSYPWGRFVFSYTDSLLTKEAASKKHLDSIRKALE